jgi:two-component system, cell cycle sensor histidine kinase and response regulator CckA
MAPNGRKLRILHIEDSVPDAQLIERQLRSLEAEVELQRVETREAILEAVVHRRPDLILSDYVLPELGGTEALSLLRGRLPDVPFIFVSGHVGEEWVTEAMRDGATDFVGKNRLSRLVPVIRRALREVEERSERRRAEEVLRRGQARTRLILDRALDAVITFDASGRITGWNPTAVAMFGHPAAEAEGRIFWKLLVPERERDAFARGIRGYLERGEEWVLRRVVSATTLRRDGVEFPVEFAITPLGEADEVSFCAFVRDVTERERAEVRFLATFEEAAIGIAHVAPDGRFIRANGRLCEILGYGRDELLQMRFQELTHPEDLGSDVEHLERMLEGSSQRYTREKRYIRKDGSSVWANLTVSLVRTEGGVPDYFISVIEDISRRKTAEEALRATEGRLRSLSDANLFGIVVSDLSGRILETNDAFLNLVGHDRESVASGRLHQRELTPPDQLEPLERARAELRTRRVVPPWEQELLRKDGSHVPVLIGQSMVQGSQDTSVAFVLDLSERRRLEAQLRQAQKMELVGRLAGGVAHDFNNLLTAILGYSDTLLGKLSGQDFLLRDVEEIKAAGERAASLTSQLLAFSRKQPVQPVVLDLNTVVQSIKKMLRRLIGEDVGFQTVLASPLGSVLADKGQIDQILMNLAVNARDAMPCGGRLIIETGNVDLGPEFVRDHPGSSAGAHVMLRFSDSGTGMSKEVLSHLFEPYFTTKERGKGTGLGLATVYGIVKQSGGYVGVESEVGRGSTFRIYLPRVEESNGSTEDSSSTDIVWGTGHVLLVEDEPMVRRLLKETLRIHGFTVIDAASAEEAIRIVQNEDPPLDLLITDLVMPGMGGRELAKHVSSRWPGLPTVFMSGYTEDMAFREGKPNPEAAFLPKPFSPSELLMIVRKTLCKRA